MRTIMNSRSLFIKIMSSKQRGEKQARLTQFGFTVKVISSNIYILWNVRKSQRMKK